MLFNSHEFLFLFLPVAWLVYVLVRRTHLRGALAWLTVASLGFYAWWYPPYLVLLLASLCGNFGLGRILMNPAYSQKVRKFWLVFGTVANVGVLLYFKYATFLVANAAALTGNSWQWAAVALPLGISFITFQKIAYLQDMYAGKITPHGFLEFCLFVTFFPQLIAGPIVHPGELLPQFVGDEALTRLKNSHSTDVACGLTIFAIGLAKKVLLADEVAGFATPVFGAASAGAEPSLLAAWGAVLAYTLQLYFDFSGYSDMAIGAARLFGIRLPLNFHSPYKSESISEFWRRWHMTLSRFLRDYIYIPLGGSRCSKPRRFFNLFATMTLGGLWHGAGWTFILWGMLHGAYLSVNHFWTEWNAARVARGARSFELPKVVACGVTFLAVVAGWVLFRSDTLATAGSMFSGMLGLNGLLLPTAWQKLLGPLTKALSLDAATLYGAVAGFEGMKEVGWVAAALAVAFFAPNTQQILAAWEPALVAFPGDKSAERKAWWQWQPSSAWALAGSCLMAVTVLRMTKISEFLYFQF